MENKILIFRTSITRKCDIKRIEKLLAQYPQIDKWNVDFEDWVKNIKNRVQWHHRTRNFGSAPE